MWATLNPGNEDFDPFETIFRSDYLRDAKEQPEFFGDLKVKPGSYRDNQYFNWDKNYYGDITNCCDTNSSGGAYLPNKEDRGPFFL